MINEQSLTDLNCIVVDPRRKLRQPLRYRSQLAQEPTRFSAKAPKEQQKFDEKGHVHNILDLLQE